MVLARGIVANACPVVWDFEWRMLNGRPRAKLRGEMGAAQRGNGTPKCPPPARTVNAQPGQELVGPCVAELPL